MYEYLKTEQSDERYRIVAEYFSKTNEAMDGMIVLDLNCGEPRFKNFIPYKKYLANDIVQPEDTKGITFFQTTDDKMDCSCDILCLFGFGGGKHTGQPLESQTEEESIVRLAKHNPKYIMLEMCQKWQNDFKIMSSMIERLPAYEVVLKKELLIGDTGHYHDSRILNILKHK